MRLEDWPPPDKGSALLRSLEKFVQKVPDPYLKSRASRTQRSIMPPSLTRSSVPDWMKQACTCGRLIGILQTVDSFGVGINVHMPLRGTCEPVDIVKPCIKPLW